MLVTLTQRKLNLHNVSCTYSALVALTQRRLNLCNVSSSGEHCSPLHISMSGAPVV